MQLTWIQNRGVLANICVTLLIVAATSCIVSAQENAGSQPTELAEANRLSAMVVKLYKDGKFDEAVPSAKRALEITERVLGPNHQMVADALTNLGELYVAKTEYSEAERVYRRQLTVYEAMKGKENLKLVPSLNRLAWLAFKQSDHDKTKAYYQRALEISEKQFPAHSTPVSDALFNLAEIYKLNGSSSKALPLYERSAKIRVTNLGSSNAKAAMALARYQCVLERSNPKEANEKAIAIRALDTRNRGVPTIVGPADSAGGGGVLNGKAIALPRPAYPAEARMAGAHGPVLVRVTIDEEGRVIDACAIKGPRSLWESSENAALGARFSPTKLSGMPLVVTGVITYNFVAR